MSLFADIMPSVNDVTVILLIPILEYIVYPHIQSVMGFTVRPMHKVRKSFIILVNVATTV